MQANGAFPGLPPPAPGWNNLANSTGKNSDVVNYAKFSQDQLRAQGVPEQLIQLVEKHRGFLTRLIEAQDKFRDGVRNEPLPPTPMQQQARSENIAANQPSTENPHIPHPSSANGLRHPNGQAPSITLNQPPAESQLPVGANGGSNEH